MQNDGVFSLPAWLVLGGRVHHCPGETAAPTPGHGLNVDTLHIVTL